MKLSNVKKIRYMQVKEESARNDINGRLVCSLAESFIPHL